MIQTGPLTIRKILSNGAYGNKEITYTGPITIRKCCPQVLNSLSSVFVWKMKKLTLAQAQVRDAGLWTC